MKNLSKILILMTLALSCGKKDTKISDHSESNTREIQKLESDLSQSQKKFDKIEKQLQELLSQKTSTALDIVDSSESNSEELMALKTEILAKIEAQSIELLKVKKELQSEIQNKISDLEERLNTKINSVESNYQNFTDKLDSVENSFVSIESFKSALNKLDEVKLEQQDLLEMKRQTALTAKEQTSLSKQIAQIKKDRRESKKEYKTYVDQAIKAWQASLETKISQANQDNSALKSFVRNELQRIVMEQNSLKNSFTQIDSKSNTLKDRIQEISTKLEASLIQRATLESTETGISQQQRDELIEKLQETEADFDIKLTQLSQKIKNLEEEKAFIKTMGAENKQALATLKVQISNFNNTAVSQKKDPIIVDSIIRDIFKVCTTTLKSDPYCYTNATIIDRLGGKLIDPTKYSRTKEDAIKYFIASGVKVKGVLDYPSSFMLPSGSNKSKFNSCHQGENLQGLIPPKKYWHKGVILSLVMEQIENTLMKQKLLKLESKDTQAMIKVLAWWRSQCYQDKLKNNGKTGNRSDHIYGSAFDLQFKNIKSHAYYKNYISQNIMKHDSLGIVHPLESSDQAFTFGLGSGHGRSGTGKMHVGIGSAVSSRSGKAIRQWRY